MVSLIQKIKHERTTKHISNIKNPKPQRLKKQQKNISNKQHRGLLYRPDRRSNAIGKETEFPQMVMKFHHMKQEGLRNNLFVSFGSIFLVVSD